MVWLSLLSSTCSNAGSERGIEVVKRLCHRIVGCSEMVLRVGLVFLVKQGLAFVRP